MAIDQDVLNHTQMLLNHGKSFEESRDEAKASQTTTESKGTYTEASTPSFTSTVSSEATQQNTQQVTQSTVQNTVNVDSQNTNTNLGGYRNMSTENKGMSLFQAGANQGLFAADGGDHSEYLTKIKERLEAMIAANHKEVGTSFGLPSIDVTNIAKQNHHGTLPYAVTVLSYIHKDPESGEMNVFYYFFQFTHTGIDAMTVAKLKETFNENRQILKNSNSNVSIKPYVLYDQAVSGKFKKILEEHLAEKYAGRLTPGSKLISLQGSNFSNKIVEHNVSPEKVANQLATIGANRLLIDFKTRFQGGRDITVEDILNAKNSSPNSILSLNVELNSPKSREDGVTDGCGNFLRNDFAGTMLIEPQGQTKQELATTNETIHLCHFKGYVTGFPGEEVVPGQFPGQAVTRLRMRPHIVLTQAISASNTIRSLQSTLLAIAASGVMLKKENYMAVLKNAVGSELNCPGAYNMICNLTNETDAKNIQPFNFNSKSFDENSTINTLNEMFSLAPILSIDVVPYTEQAGVDNVLMLASTKSNKNSDRARKIIVEACRNLTNGHFPSNFPFDKIFYMDAVPFPAGHFTSKNKDMDIRYLDLATVLAHSKGNELLIGKYMAANVSDSNTDPFFGEVECLDEIGANHCTVISRGLRCTFTPEFINALTTAVSAAGLNPTYNSFGVQAQGRLSIDRFSMFYKDAGIVNGGFGTQRVFDQGLNSVPTFMTHYYL